MRPDRFQQPQFRQLEEKVARLESRLPDKKGFLAWIGKWGVLGGLIATVMSIVGGAIGISISIQKLNPKPATKGFHFEDGRLTRT
jgi:hypothetical protein